MYEAINVTQIGKRIKDLRIQKNMTAEDLGKALGISSSAVNMYECGQRVPRDEIKISIAEYFGVSVESIFYPTK